MSYGYATKDPLDLLAELDRRLANLEQMATAPSAAATNVAIGSTVGNPAVVLQQIISPVTGVTVVPGALFSSIYADVSWTPPSDGSAVAYDVTWAQDAGGGVYSNANAQRVGGTNYRIIALSPNTPYVVAVYAVNALGQSARYPPAAGSYVSFTSTQDAVAPPAVSNVLIGVGATSIIITFTGLTMLQAPDVANNHGLYQVDISTDPTFGTVSESVRTGATVVAFNDLNTSSTWYARVSAIDSSGNQGPYVLSSGNVAGGVVDAMLVGNFSAVHITFGSMSGDRIQGNTLDVGSIKTSTLSVSTIILNGGALTAGNPPTTGLILNSQGLRLYQNGSITVALDAITGIGTFNGNLSGNQISGATITGSSLTVTDGVNSVTTATDPRNGNVGLIFGTADGSTHNGLWWANNSTGGLLEVQTPTSNGSPYACLLYMSASGTNNLQLGQVAELNTNGTCVAQSFVTYSARELKANIQDAALDVSPLYDLPVRKYRMVGSDEDIWNYGFVTEEAEPLLPYLVSHNAHPETGEDRTGINLNHLFALLVASYQERNRRLDELERTL